MYFTSTTRDKQREVVQEKWMKYMPKRFIKRIFATRECWEFMELENPDNPKDPMNGTQIFFKTYEAGVKAFEGASIDLAGTDEEPPKPIYEAIKARLLDRTKVGNGWFMNAMTPDPDEGLTWTFHEIVENNTNPDREVVYLSMYDNEENLGKKEIDDLSATYDEDTRKARVYGLHVNRAGFVLKNFIAHPFPNGHVLSPFNPDWRLFTPYEFADYGFKHPFHIGFYAINKEGEVFKYDELHLKGKTIQQVKRELYFKRLKYGYKEPNWGKIDPSANTIQGTSGFSPVSLLAHGFNPEPKDKPDVWIGPVGDDGAWPEDKNLSGWVFYPVFYSNACNDRDAGWAKLNERLRFKPGINRPDFFYTDNCVNSIRQGKNLCWPKESTNSKVSKAKEIARKSEDDGPDTDRYMSNDDIYFDPDYNPKSSFMDAEYESTSEYSDEDSWRDKYEEEND